MIEGIDVAALQHPNGETIDYAAVYDHGVRWACVKVDEGTSYVNPWAPQDCAGFKAAGITVDVYHFARPGKASVADSIAHLVDHTPSGAQYSRVWLDFEVADGLDWPALAAWADEWQRKLVGSGIYYNQSWRDNLAAAGLDWRGPVWLAAPSLDMFPADVDVWQYGQAWVPGIGAVCDLDRRKEQDMTPEEVQQAVTNALVAFFGDWPTIEAHVKAGCAQALAEHGGNGGGSVDPAVIAQAVTDRIGRP